MTASFFRRTAFFVPAIASVFFFAGCSPESLDLGEVTPPQPAVDPAVRTVFNFEADQMPPVSNGSFTIGEDPLTATFAGGEVVATPLARTPSQAWLISEGNSGTVTFGTPATGLKMFFRNELDPTAARFQPSRGGVQCDPPIDFGLNPGEDFGAELFVRGDFNGWAGETSEPPTNFVNFGDNVYKAQFAMVAGTSPFKIASEDWSIEYNNPDIGLVVGTPWQTGLGEAGSDNSNFNIPADGCYTWTITIIDDGSSPAPTIEVLVEEFVPSGPVVCEIPDFGLNPGEAFGAELFVRGEFNGWAGETSELATNFVNLGEGVYRAAFELGFGSSPFKIASEDWSIEYSDGIGPTLDVPWQVALSEGGSDNSSFQAPAEGCYSFTITVIDDSSSPAPLIEVLFEEFAGTPTGGGGDVRSEVRVYDVLDNVIETYDGFARYLVVEIERADNEPLISRIEIDNIAPEGESGVGFVAVDDFEFRAAPQTEPRSVVLVYTRPGGDYSNTVFNVAGDVEGGARAYTCQIPPAPEAGGCFAVVTILPGGTITYTVSNDGVADEAGEIELGYNEVVTELVFNFSGSNIPVTTGLPVTPQDNEIILFYKRDDDADPAVYDGWGLHLFPVTSPDWTLFPTPGEYLPSGIDPFLGAYFIIGLPGSDRLSGDGYSANPEELTVFPPSLGFIIHKGNEKDPGPDQFVRIAEDGNYIFVRSGVNSVSTTPPVEGGVALAGAEAHWVSQDTLVWNSGSGIDSAQLLYSADGRIREAGGNLVGVDMRFDLSAGVDPVLPNSTHLEGLTPYSVPAEALDMVDVLITGQLLVVGLDAAGNEVFATGVQFPLLLDDLFAEAAADATFGVDYSSGTPSLSVWAPTSTMAWVNIYDTADATTPSSTEPMEYDDTTGIWSIDGTADWDRKYYTYTVTNYAPTASRVVDSEVTDPYSVNISAGSANRLVKSQMINLDDADLKPMDWDSFMKPALEAPEDIVLYELHVRDFSALDSSVMTDDQGKFTAFANGGDGAAHLMSLAEAGLTHVHILPPFDIASVNEDPAQRVDLGDPIADLCALNPSAQSFCDMHSGTILEALQSYGPGDPGQSELVEVLRGFDSFNWGYDPVHFNVPEGAYSSNPDTEARILEFRTMVKGLSDLGLRTVIDQVYNHTNASGHLSQNSVLDKVVPGYYHRLDDRTGGVLRESCCDDTAAEHAMMDKFIVDSMVQWTKAYKVDGFRLDLMSFHPLSTMERARDALQALTLEEDGVDGSTTYIYGEGWNTGTPANDGRFINARQDNLAGTGIGSFNDRIRDAVRGGGPFDSGPGHIDTQGFISGQFYDPNDNNTGSDDERNGLLGAADRIRVAMAGGLSGYPLTDSNDSATTGGGIGAGYTDDPEEIVNYVSSHDGETLWDIAQYKHPIGTTTADRVRAHNLGNSIVILGQGVPFLHAGQDLLRSKSMDRNSFDSSDWFNRIDFSGDDNNFAVGLPLSGDNSGSLTEIGNVLALGAADPGSADIMFAADVTKEFLEIRKDTQLFRLRSSADVVNRVVFHNTGSMQVPGMIVMSIDGCVTADYTPEYGSVVTVINATTTEQVFDLYGDRTFGLHPVQASSVDSVVMGAFHDTDGFHVPARTTAVFTEAQGGVSVCGFGANFAEETAYVSGDFNGNAFTNAMIQVGDTNIIETTVTLPVGTDQRYKILSSDSASINCGGPAGGGPLFTPASNGGTTFTNLSCGADPDDLSLDAAMEGRYKFSLDTSNILNPALVYREQAGTGFPIAGGGCGVSGSGNNAEFFGEEMFVRGGFNDWLNPPPEEYKLINTGNREFQVEVDILSGDWEFKIASADWGPEYTSSTPVALGMTEAVPLGEPGSSNIPMSLPEDGCYNFTVVPSEVIDMESGAPESIDMTVSLKPQDTGDPTDTPLVRGGFNDWGETDPMMMVNDTTFETIVTIAAAGDYEFKVASADWAIVNCGGPHNDLGTGAMDIAIGAATTLSCGQNPANLMVSFAEAGDYTFRINTANRNNPSLTIESFVGAGFNTEGFGLPSVYLQGDFNMFSLDNVMTDSTVGRRYFTTVSLDPGPYEFRFESADGVTINCGTPAGGSSNVTVGSATTIACGQNLANLAVDIVTTDDYTFAIDLIAGTPVAPVLTIIQPQ